MTQQTEPERREEGDRGASSGGWPAAWAALRARDWLHFTLLPLAGAAFGGVDVATAVVRGGCIAAAILGYGYLLNGIADRSLDRDPNKNPLVRIRRLGWHPFALLAGTLAVAVSLSLTGPTAVRTATAVALLAGTAYSIGPRLKALPGLGTLMNVACFAPLLFVGLAQPSAPPALVALACAFSALLIQNQLIHEAADAVDDARAGVRTTYLALGAGGTAIGALLAGAMAGAAIDHLFVMASMPRWIALHAVGFVAVFPLWLWRQSGDASAMSRARLVHRVAAVGSGALSFWAAATVGAG